MGQSGELCEMVLVKHLLTDPCIARGDPGLKGGGEILSNGPRYNTAWKLIPPGPD